MSEMSIDELSREADVPGRTIREYQTMRVLPPPRRQGRKGVYEQAHVQRLRLIARLQERGYSLAGIRDLLAAYDGGGDLLEVLADPDLGIVEESHQLISDAELADLTASLSAHQVQRFTDTGLVRPHDDRHCVASPPLIRFVAAATDAGFRPDDIDAALTSVIETTRAAAEDIVEALTRSVEVGADTGLETLERCRLLLGQGVGRLLMYELGVALIASGNDDIDQPC